MAPVSVIIPTFNAASDLGPCLGALGEALFDGLICEVIITDGGSDDDVADVADAVGAILVEGPPGRGRQLAAGVRAAKGDWLLILHADSVLEEDWAKVVAGHIRAHPDSAGYFRLRFDRDHRVARWTAAWANLRARLFRLPYGDQGLLVPRKAYERAGGYPESPLMEDVALARRLGRDLRPLAAEIVTSAERYERNGWFRQGSANLWRLIRYFCGVPPERLIRGYD